MPAEVSLKMSPAVATPSMPLHLRNSTLMHVKGPKGSLTVPLQSFVEHTWPSDEQQPQISFTVKDESVRRQRAAWGLTRQLAANAIHGVSQGHTATLQLVGVGYRAHLEGSDKLALKLGYPNLVMENIPQGIEVSVDSPTEITLKGADKAQLGQFAAQIRRWRKPEPYNGKVCLLTILVHVL